jgi:hypothetical protein
LILQPLWVTASSGHSQCIVSSPQTDVYKSLFLNGKRAYRRGCARL